MSLSREHFQHLIPHAGAMCLIDRVVEWNETTIRCSSASHRGADHPLSDQGRLHAVCAVEYAAQAAALHGGLRAEAAGHRSLPGVLAGLRGVTLGLQRLDDLVDDLLIVADCRWADAAGFIYEVAVGAGAKHVLAGRLTIVLNSRVFR